MQGAVLTHTADKRADEGQLEDQADAGCRSWAAMLVDLEAAARAGKNQAQEGSRIPPEMMFERPEPSGDVPVTFDPRLLPLLPPEYMEDIEY